MQPATNSTQPDPVRQIRVPLFPLYSHVRALVEALDGRQLSDYMGLIHQVDELKGTPQANVDWSAPDEWIAQRLRGRAVDLAREIWRGGLNPRHTKGSWYLARTYELITESSGTLCTTERGAEFLANPEGPVTHEIDAGEGILRLLSIVAERGVGTRGDFLPDWNDYAVTNSNYRSEVAVRETLRVRLLNLAERKLLDRSGNTYTVTERGLTHLESVRGSTGIGGERSQVRRLIRAEQEAVRLQLLEYLEKIEPPAALETVVKRLLEEMGYTNVETTSPSNDKGVDVVADIEVGITQLREVVQVKRRQGNLHRTVLDQLRGSLHRFQALRGTIITTGGFSSGARAAAFEQGAAPITLIDGEKLIDLLVSHRLGVRKQSLELLELDLTTLTAGDDSI